MTANNENKTAPDPNAFTRDDVRHLRHIYHDWLMSQRDKLLAPRSPRTIGDLANVSSAYRDVYLPLRDKLDDWETSLPMVDAPEPPPERTPQELAEIAETIARLNQVTEGKKRPPG